MQEANLDKSSPWSTLDTWASGDTMDLSPKRHCPADSSSASTGSLTSAQRIGLPPGLAGTDIWITSSEREGELELCHDSAINSNHLTLVRAENIANPAWEKLRKILLVLKESSGMFPPLGSALGILLSDFVKIERILRNQRDYEDLAEELTSLSESLVEQSLATTIAMSNSITGFANGIEKLAIDIREKLSPRVGGRFALATSEEEVVVRYYRRIQSLFRQLQLNMSLSTWTLANEHLVNTRLEALNPEKQAFYDSRLSTAINRRTCTEGTRVEVRSNLVKWIYDPHSPAIYWINGMAGTGKTTLACTFSDWLERRKLLAASFFCTRTSADCRDVTKIIPSIAYQLARYSAPFQRALYSVLGEDPDAGAKNVSKQFERLLINPLKRVDQSMSNTFVVVIDALDELDHRDGVEIFLDLLLRHGEDIPIKFLLTSRPEPGIYDTLSLHQQSRAAVHLHDIEKSLVQSDIEIYLKEELAFVSPSLEEIGQLAHRSGTLFIYAATIARYIQGARRRGDPHQRLRSVLNMTAEAATTHARIDALYGVVLDAALSPEEMEPGEMEDIRAVLRTVLFAQEPISVGTIAYLTAIDNLERVEAAIQPLRSVLHQSEETKLVSTLHASFPDFMFNSERSGAYFCDVIKHSQKLAQRCFLVMQEQLRFNICCLSSSFVPDEKLENLQDRIKEKVPPALAYASSYWAHHLQVAHWSESLTTMLGDFLANRLLFWMEVLNLKRGAGRGVESLRKAQTWLSHSRSASSELACLLEDACNFATGFAANPVSCATPHLYISALPFCPRSSSVYKHYRTRMCGLLELKGTLIDRREVAALARWDIGSPVLSATYSPNGALVAIGCKDGGVSVRNSYDGALVVGPLKAHKDYVRSIVFSPDSSRIISGSDDYTIQDRSSLSGSIADSPFKGHTDIVLSVAFSSDGRHIASSSRDHTIRIWNSSDGTPTLEPLKDHKNWVHCVAFSPDNGYIASSYDDGSIRLWNAQNGAPVVSPMKGHTESVWSVVFTPDSRYLVSGSNDNTIRIWNTLDGSPVAHPFKGHTNWVTTVAVSPDSTRVASGSRDNTVRVWNIDDGSLASGPFCGHNHYVHSVAFSPDGTRVISGSEDGTICIWNVRDGLITGSLSAQYPLTDISSITVSPDNMKILSSSTNNNIGIWDIQDGAFSRAPAAGQFLSTASSVSPDGAYIISHSPDQGIQVLSANNCSLIAGPFPGQPDSPSSIRFSEDNKSIIIGSADGNIQIRSLQNGENLIGPLIGHTGAVTNLALSTDGSYLVSYSKDDKSLRVWNKLNPTLGIASLADSTHNCSPDDFHAGAFEGWDVREDGWVVNKSGQLLFWIPADLAAVRPSHHTALIITKLGTLQIPEQRLIIGDEWSRCYVEHE